MVSLLPRLPRLPVRQQIGGSFHTRPGVCNGLAMIKLHSLVDSPNFALGVDNESG